MKTSVGWQTCSRHANRERQLDQETLRARFVQHQLSDHEALCTTLCKMSRPRDISQPIGDT